jgi:uncharacterized membrane protein YqaE (UPF0057 family)
VLCPSESRNSQLIPAYKSYVSVNRWNESNIMSCLRAIVCIIFPPLSVIDRGLGTVLLVLLLTIAGYIPGVIAALLLNYMAAQSRR